MPKVSYTDSKGLFQETGKGVVLPVRRSVTALTNAAAVTRTLTVEESGTLFTCSLTAVDNDITLTLPAIASSAGVCYDIAVIANTDDDADLVIKTEGNAVDIFGSVVRGGADSKVSDLDGVSKITLDGSASQATKGTRFHLECDGASWHLTGYCPVAIGTAVIVESADV